MKRPKHPLRALLLVIAATAAAGIVAPMLSAGAFKHAIQQSIEQGLQRKVEINGKVVFNLFTGPGFSVGDVLIHDDPRAGIEPFAFVEWIDARVRLTSLLRGRLEFSRLRLDTPTVNLVKTSEGGWNVQAYLERTASATSSEAARLPAILVRDGRINFKFGDTKSVFYITNADVDVYPAAAGEDVSISFEGQPARTDRPAVGFGRFSGRGQWKSSPNRQGQLAVNLQLEKSNLADISTLLYGRDAGLHGTAASRARIAGPVSDLRITGQLQIADIHRWDLLPTGGEGFPIEYAGTLDLRSQRLEIATVAPKEGTAPVSIRFLASGIMSRLRWEAAAGLNGIPLASVAEVARHMGTPLPPNVAMEGKVDGAIAYSPEEGLRGDVQVTSASIQAPGSDPVRMAEAHMKVASTGIELAPADIEIGSDRGAVVEAAYAFGKQALDVTVKARRLHVREFAAAAAQLLASPGVPLLEQFQSGAWSGAVRYRVAGTDKGQWSGSIELRDAAVALPGLVDPLRIVSANVALDGSRVIMNRVQARAGKTRFEGEYRYVPDAERPHRFRVSINQADASELERLLTPTLRRRQSFLERALRMGGSPAPDWLKDRRVSGTLRIASLTIGGDAIGPVRAAFTWDGVEARFSEIEARYEDAALTGTLDVSLAKNLPAYALEAEVKGLAWKGGTLDGSALLETSGLGRSLVLNLKAEGTFRGQTIELDSENTLRTVSGEYEITLIRGTPRLVLTAIQATAGPDSYSGQGTTQPDGRIQCDLASPKRQLRIAGTLVPLKLEVAR